ncbi:MAG: O-antigen ligase family protein [Candidatus Limnocylindrus sp.]
MGKASRRKQDPYAGVNGEGKPLFPADERAQTTISGVPASWIVAVVAGGLWVAAHLLAPASLALTVAYVGCGLALGLINPTLAAMFVVALVPFQGGGTSQGLGELSRSAPILGAALRLLWNRFSVRGDQASPWQPSRILLAAAVLAMLLYPLTRITANGAEWAPESRLVDDLLFMFGAPAAAYASWIVFSHLSQAEIGRILRMLPISLAAALGVAVAAWMGITLADPFAFEGIVYGRLGALGYPTPTAMGVAISLPVAGAALWERSRRSAVLLIAIGVVVIVLTQSRGPLLALILGAGAVALIRRQIPRRYVIGGAAVALSALTILLLVRYPDLIRKLSNGRLPSLRGDELRIISWIASFQIALANPLTGGGWMSVRGWNDSELGSRNVNLSHNMVLQGLADGGVPLGVALATVVLGSLRSAWRQRRRIPASWLCAALVVLVCGLWDMPQLRAYAAVMAGAALGLVARRFTDEDEALA